MLVTFSSLVFRDGPGRDQAHVYISRRHVRSGGKNEAKVNASCYCMVPGNLSSLFTRHRYRRIPEPMTAEQTWLRFVTQSHLTWSTSNMWTTNILRTSWKSPKLFLNPECCFRHWVVPLPWRYALLFDLRWTVPIYDSPWVFFCHDLRPQF